MYSVFQDYTQNTHGKEIDLLRVTVKVPGKRPPRAVAPAAPPPARRWTRGQRAEQGAHHRREHQYR